jgi:hypothetical protein
MSDVNLLRRAWDTLDTFRQAYPENWHDEDEQLMKDLIRADNDLSGVKRKWVGLTNNDLQPIAEEYRILFGSWVHDFARAIETKLKEKNHVDE